MAVLKGRIVAQESYTLKSLRIIFSGKVLKNDSQTLEGARINSGNFIVVMGKKAKVVKQHASHKQEDSATVKSDVHEKVCYLLSIIINVY